MGLYELEFKYIPFLLDQCARGEVDATCLVDVEKFRKLLENEGIEVTWKWEYFSVTRKKVGETLMIIYTLPRPIRPPHAKYSAIMTTKKGIEYFLLESDYENGKPVWYLCTQNLEKRFSFGKVPDCRTIQEFVELLLTTENSR